MNKAVLEYDLYTINEHKELKNISLALSIKHHNKFLMKDIIENLFENDLSQFEKILYILFKHYHTDSELQDLVYYFINNKAPINYSELYFAAKIGNMSLVKLLFEKGAKILPMTIQIASANKHFDIVLFLIDKITDTYLINKKTLQYVFSNGPLELILYLFELHKKSNKFIDIFSLRYLFYNNRLSIIKELMKKHSDILYNIGPYCIRDSYEHGHYELLEYLMKHRFQIDIFNTYIYEKSKEFEALGITLNNVEYS